MIIKIGFNPENIKPEDEAYPAFKAGGVVLRFWALYKKGHITSQYFREGLVKLAEMVERARDEEDKTAEPYQDIDDFMAWLGICGFYGGAATPRFYEFGKWVAKHWDYFNPNIQRGLVLQYKVVKEVEEDLVI